MVMTNTPIAPYPSLFRVFIEQALKRSLAQVQCCPGPLSEDVRDQALHAVSFGLKLAPAWALTRALLIELAPKMEQMGHRDDWLPYLKAALQHKVSLAIVKQRRIYT